MKLPSFLGAGASQRVLVQSSWDRLSRAPGGKALFNALIARLVPYTGSIRPRVEVLSPGFAQVSMRDTRRVRNHLDCVHAVALVNLGELTANLAVMYSMPKDARVIPKGLSAEYVKKARGPITATCSIEPPETSERHEREVLVQMKNARGEVVTIVRVDCLIGPAR